MLDMPWTHRFLPCSDADDIICGWLKMRGLFKQWTRKWFVLRPGALLHYKDMDMGAEDAGTIDLRNCDVVVRESKKSGFCFKVYNRSEMKPRS